MRKVVLIDAMNLVYRSYHVNRFTTEEGKVPTGCIYGCLKAILDIYRSQGQVDVVLFWEGGINGDKPIESYKKALARDIYKSQRVPHDDIKSIMFQAGEVNHICDILKIGQVSIPGMQADDAIGLFCKVYEEDLRIQEVLIYSTDSDYNQLLNEKVSIIKTSGSKAIKFTHKKVLSEYGVEPDQWANYRALCGKPSDNYKGVHGVGPKTAAKLLEFGLTPSTKEFKDLPKPVRKKYADLEDTWDNVHLCYVLAKIPKSLDDPNIPGHVKVLAKQVLKEKNDIRRRRATKQQKAKAYKRFLSFCARYELLYFIAHKAVFLNGISVID
jgi:5'-3' exonuclease